MVSGGWISGFKIPRCPDPVELELVGVGDLAPRALDFAPQRCVVLQGPVAANGEYGVCVLCGLPLQTAWQRSGVRQSGIP